MSSDNQNSGTESSKSVRDKKALKVTPLKSIELSGEVSMRLGCLSKADANKFVELVIMGMSDDDVIDFYMDNIATRQKDLDDFAQKLQSLKVKFTRPAVS